MVLRRVLAGTLLNYGFQALARSFPQQFALWAVGVKEEQDIEERLRGFAAEFFPS